ncbi:MAG: hypothetical protein WB462_10245 [Solirubrobacterales bacterium]
MDKTKQISTNIDVDVIGVIDRHGSVNYVWAGELYAKRSACLDGRNVTLFRVEPKAAKSVSPVRGM